jgi:hypothetical protein
VGWKAWAQGGQGNDGGVAGGAGADEALLAKGQEETKREVHETKEEVLAEVQETKQELTVLAAVQEEMQLIASNTDARISISALDRKIGRLLALLSSTGGGGGGDGR